MKTYYFDTETIGFEGVIITIQYCIDEGEAIYHEVWKKPVRETIALIDDMVFNRIVGFNLGFDWFHTCKLYSILKQLPQDITPETVPPEVLAELELKGRFLGCLKPCEACDLMLHAQTGPLQSLMDREQIIIRKIPVSIAEEMCEYLEKRIPIDDIYFAKYKKEGIRWKAYPNRQDSSLYDIVLKFKASTALKPICKHLGIQREGRKEFKDILPENMPQMGRGYAPWGKETWELLHSHIEFWHTNKMAREYALDDALDTRALYNKLGSPGFNSDNDILSTMVAATRWRGFNVNNEALDKVIDTANKQFIDLNLPINVGSGEQVYNYIAEKCVGPEKAVMHDGNAITTKSSVLKKIATWREGEPCDACDSGMDVKKDALGIPILCSVCNGDGFVETNDPHPASIRADEVLKARKRLKLIEILSKIHDAGRMHPDFKVIGALSGRMSGAGSVNYQGIPAKVEIRAAFPLAEQGEVLSGGDFSGFEATIAAAKYNDPQLIKDIENSGKIHALFGASLYGKTPEEVTEDKDMYKKAKIGLFSLFYGAQPYSISIQTGVPLERAEKAYKDFFERYPAFAKVIKGLEEDYSPFNGREWKEPKNYAESMLGFKRYYDLEIYIMRELFNFSEDLPVNWVESRERVNRGKYEQQLGAAVKSAIKGCIHSIKNGMVRTAMNHGIQATGGQITKKLQVLLWNNQPIGYNPWKVRQFQVHDEILTVTDNSLPEKLKNDVHGFIQEMKSVVPLLDMEFKTNCNNWAEVK